MMPKNWLYLLSRERIISILKNPEAHPQEAVLLMGMFIVVVLMILTIAALIVFRPSKEKRKPREKLTKRQITIRIGITLVIILVLLASAMYYSSLPNFCRSCHTMKGEYYAWKESPHKKVNCLSCHQQPGVLGLCMEKTRMTSMIISQLRRSYKEPITAMVRDESCLSCHSDITQEKKIRYTIRVSHKEILDSGYKCTNCHNTIAHGKMVPNGKFPAMERCVLCHNDKRASSNCRLCHIEDIGKNPREEVDFPKVHLEEPTSCRGCHPIETCNQCHGLEMPHPPNWEKKHPREGFVNKKLCWKCHNMPFCQHCHKRMPWPHAEDFPKTHGPASKVPGACGCHEREKFCPICHE
ncbi:MAG: NapC/NirT family cytochrome c [Actinomycetota bacterium]